MSKYLECAICGSSDASYWEGIDDDICEECKSRILEEAVSSLWIHQIAKITTYKESGWEE